MALELNGSTVIVNGETIAIAKKPKYRNGEPKINTHTSLVGEQVHVTQSQDFSEAIGEVTITLRNTKRNVLKLEEWQSNVGLNAVRIVDNRQGFNKTFNEMSVSDDVEIDFDGEEFEVVFQGAQGV